jgi:hypothetical protein
MFLASKWSLHVVRLYSSCGVELCFGANENPKVSIAARCAAASTTPPSLPVAKQCRQ